MTFPFVKGHGARNDFVVLPDLDSGVHADLESDLVRRLCDRRSGIGADGVLRVLRGDIDGGADWFMDYRNADGSVSEMCGNGIRVFARYLVEAGLADATNRLSVDTRDGVKDLVFCDDGEISVDMGIPVVGARVWIGVNGRACEATAVELGNPHAVSFVDSLEAAGALHVSPRYAAEDFPGGVNIEFVVRRDDGSLAMRVFERGVGETQSCGTGACSAVVADQWQAGTRSFASYPVILPGGTLTVTWDASDHVHLKGPAELVAEGVWTA